jgi:hypothetical protein
MLFACGKLTDFVSNIYIATRVIYLTISAAKPTPDAEVFCLGE